MKDGKCSKGYPKPFAEITTSGSNEYPIYRRCDNGQTLRKERVNYEFTNRDVVPYNPYLTELFNCHINVEIATSIRSVKYLYKYIYKGHDRTTVSIQSEGNETVDEVKDYLDAQYVSDSEACWRILQFDMHEYAPSVERLPIHIEGGQNIPYDPTTETAAVGSLPG